MSVSDWSRNLYSLGVFGGAGCCCVCNVWGALGRELMDVLGRDFLSAFLPPWQRVALAKILDFWEGDGGGALALKILGG